jgi:phosphatidylglycerol:prolipoprotein diacylglycerol transferase
VLWDCTAALRFWEGGLVYWGGVITAAGATWLVARRSGTSFPKLVDAFIPGLALGHVLGRLGCFVAGCCYGKACDTGALACIAFPAGSVAHADRVRRGLLSSSLPATPPLHPTQLYEAGAELVIFCSLLLLRRRVRAPGAVALAYALLYGAARFAVELYRGDPARRFLFEMPWPGLAARLGLPPGEPLLLSTAQATSLLVVAFAAVALAALIRRTRQPVAAPQP